LWRRDLESGVNVCERDLHLVSGEFMNGWARWCVCCLSWTIDRESGSLRDDHDVLLFISKSVLHDPR